MIRKIIIFSENNGSWYNYMKSASSLRLSYMLRSLGYEVKQVHNSLSFSTEEIKHIVQTFAQGQQVLACFSSSFISTTRKDRVTNVTISPSYNLKLQNEKLGSEWGEKTFAFFLKTFYLLKQMNIPILLGGWRIERNKFETIKSRTALGLDLLDKYVDLYVVGNNVDLIIKMTKNESIDYETINGSRVGFSSNVTDFSDCASTPLIEDYVSENESLPTEIAAGCIFSCQFCNYGSLGKKKNEFVRTYESLERELITNYENFKTRVYLLTDNMMNDYEEKLKYLIRIREKTGIDIRWVGYVRLDTIKRKEQAQLMLDSGIAAAAFGIETFKKEAGPSIGKMTDKAKLMQSMETFRSVIGDNCMTTGSFIAGLPTETIEELWETKEWLDSKEGRHYIDHYTFKSLILYPGNEVKNDINVSRNDPFSVYKRGNENWEWESPWGTSDEFMKLVAQFKSSVTTNISAFSVPFFHNAGLQVEDCVRVARNIERKDQNQILDKLKPNYIKQIETYKSKMIGGS